MPREFNELAEYNARVRKGIVHTAVYQERMFRLQVRYDMWNAEQLTAEGFTLQNGMWIKDGRSTAEP